jgi:Ca2+-binding RTX toxin-like protein
MPNPPIINDTQGRIQSILNNTSARFEIAAIQSSDERWHEGYAVNSYGINAVSRYNAFIEHAAYEQGIKADWLRSIMYLENSQGIIKDTVSDFIGRTPTSLLPMNIQNNTWAGLGGFSAEDFSDPEKNIKAAAILLKRINDRLAPENQTLENVASVWNFTGNEQSTDFGARAKNILENRLWEDPQNYSYRSFREESLIDGTRYTTGAINTVKDLIGQMTEPVKLAFGQVASLSQNINSAFDYYLGDNVVNDVSHQFFSNTSFANSFTSLGYSNSFVDEFDEWGYSLLGYDNAKYDDFSFDFGGSNFTIFGEDDRLRLDGNLLFSDSYFGSGFDIKSPLDSYDFLGTFSTYQNHISPLAFDLDNDGIESTGIYDTRVYFDIDGDQFAEKVGWIAPDDGLLALDVNGDGIINDITELFGDDIMPAFDKLARHDSNGDGAITAADADYARLKVWRDFDQDGFSDANELFALNDASISIKSISLAETPQETYQNENYISGSSSFTRYDNTTSKMYDVHFLNDNVNTWFMGARSEEFGSTYEVSPEALLMPLSRGYGSLASLHIAMTDNKDLRTMMRELVNLDASDIGQVSAKMQAFLYEWAGVTDNDPNSRQEANGSNIDARKVDFLEKFTGVTWAQMGVTDIVGNKASLGAKKIWTEIENLITARVLVQGVLKAPIFHNASYDFKTDAVTLGDTMATLIARAQTYIAGADTDQKISFWQSMGNILILHKEELGTNVEAVAAALDAAYGAPLYISQQTLTQADGDIYSAINDEDEYVTTNTYVGTDGNDTVRGSNANDYIFGKGGTDTLNGLAGDDFIRGDDGNDVMDAGDGDDRLEGKGGDDTLIGGAGRDDIRGGEGVDTLIGGAGNDKLHGGEGADIIDGGTGRDELDYLESNAGVYVNLLTHQVDGGHAKGDIFTNIENLTGSDYSDVLIGDTQNNIINGELGDDVIYGGAGDDQLFSAGGRDQMYGEAGNDALQAFDDAELFDGGAGIDTVYYNYPSIVGGIHVDLKQGKGFVGASKGDTYVNIENVVGSEQSDIVIGDDGDNILNGVGGNDILKGGAGNDILIGDVGINQYVGGAGNDTFVIVPHAAGTEIIHDFNPAQDKLDYTRFTSGITTSASIDLTLIRGDTLVTIDGANNVLLRNIQPSQLSFSSFLVNGTDTTLSQISVVSDASAGSSIQGDEYGNKLNGSLKADVINGNDGDDTINGLVGNDILAGGNGNDTFTGGYGADQLDGGSGNDLINYLDSYEGVTINLLNGTGVGGTAQGDTLTNIERVEGSVFDDVITGNSLTKAMSGNVGNDILYMNGGQNVTLIGGEGNDRFMLTQVSGSTIADTGLSVIKQNADGSLSLDASGNSLLTGGTPTALTYITDFEAGNSNEKIDLSSFNITDMYIARIDGIQVNGEDTKGVAVQLFNGSQNQTILLKDADYSALNQDNFVLPNNFSFSQVHWQIRGDNNSNLLLGSDNDDIIFPLDGSDIVVGGIGNDEIYGYNVTTGSSINYGHIDYLVQVNAGDTDSFYKFDAFYYNRQWFSNKNPLQISTAVLTGENAVNSIEKSGVGGGIVGFEVDSATFNLSKFVNIRSISDLTASVIGNDTIIHLGNDQNLVLKDYKQGIQYSTKYQFWDEPSYNIVGHPEQKVILLGTVVTSFVRSLQADNFVFYDGKLNGTSASDTLDGGNGVDEIKGFSGNDILNGGLGDDILDGGDNADIYIIGKESGATDTIVNFEYWRPDEKINLTAFNSSYANFVALAPHIAQNGADTHIYFGSNQKLVLSDFNAQNLTANNFIGNASINIAPVAVNDSFGGIQEASITGNVLANNGNGVDSDADAGTVRVAANTFETVNGGIVVLESDGAFVYTPAAGFHGQDTFNYTLLDGQGGAVVGNVSIVVQTANAAPISKNDYFAAFTASTTSKNLLTNNGDGADTDPDNDTLSVVAGTVATTSGGTAVISSNGNFSYTSAAGFTGRDTFTYTLQDVHGGTSAATVSIQVGNNSVNTLTGTDGNDVFNVYGGDDIVSGGNGVDTIYGGDGNDTINGNLGNDLLYGGAGVDTIYGGSSADHVQGDDGDDILYGEGGIDRIEGNNGNDIMYGGDGDDVFRGGYDNDLAFGDDGNDTINGEWGNDELHGGAGDDSIKGGTEDDILYGDDGVDFLRGENGNDTLYGGASDLISDGRDQQLWGGSGNDTIYGGTGFDIIRGDSGKDTAYGGAADDNINGGAGDDTLHGDAGNDVIYGGTGDDTIMGGAGNDKIFGEEGQDILDGGEGDDEVRGGIDSNIVRGGAGNDDVYGGSIGGAGDISGNDELYGDAGNDRLFSGAGDDILDGGADNDELRGLEGNDTYRMSAGADYILDLSGAQDTLLVTAGLDANNLVFSNVSLRNAADTNNLVISWDGGTNSAEIENQNTTTPNLLIEKLQFDDGYALTLGRYTTWVKGTSAGAVTNGTSADNTILGYGGDDTISGLDGNDEIHGGDGNDTVNGGNGNDLLHGGRGNDTVNGDAGDDTLYGGAGTNALAGGAGNDTYIITSGTDTITETSGVDTLKFASEISLESLTFTNIGTSDVTITSVSGAIAVIKNQRSATADLRVDTIAFAEGFALNFADYNNWRFATSSGGNLYGDNNNSSGIDRMDTLIGGVGNDSLRGYDMNDTIYGGAGVDTIFGGSGDDVVHGGTGDDIVKGDAGQDIVYGGDGNDKLYGETNASDTTGDNDTLYGGAGNDEIYAGVGNDTMFGGDGNDIIRGQAGIDTVSGGKGNDDIDGGDDNDIVNGDDGDDAMSGGNGDDVMRGGFGADNIVGNNGVDVIYGDSGDDILNGSAGIDTVYGGAGNDTIYGGATNTAFGETDYLYGDDGDDIIKGQDGNDVIYGGAGADIIQGDAGVDTLYGGADGDIFVFLAASAFSDVGGDVIKDFVVDDGAGGTEDMLNIADLLVGYNATTSAITDFLTMTTSGADTLVSVDRDGTGSAHSFQQIARLQGISGLTDEAALLASGNILI